MVPKPNLDFLRAFAVTTVVLDHTLLAKDVLQLGSWEVDWIGVFGVYLFFVHTCLVLMWSLSRRPVHVRVLPSARIPYLPVIHPGDPCCHPFSRSGCRNNRRLVHSTHSRYSENIRQPSAGSKPYQPGWRQYHQRTLVSASRNPDVHPSSPTLLLRSRGK